MPAKNRTTMALPRAAVAFRSEFLDFQRGIRVGNLNDNERITRILKLALESGSGQPFVTERWGRGIYWQWIGYLPRVNRTSKPISSQASFGCSKLFISVDTGARLFKCGLQVERGYVKAPEEYRLCELAPDWDWHRLVRQLKKKGEMERELRRLIQHEGFAIHAGSWEETPFEISGKRLPDIAKIRHALTSAPEQGWAGFQLYYPFPEDEIKASSGADLIEAMLAVFKEVTPAMNLCMQIQLNWNGMKGEK